MKQTKKLAEGKNSARAKIEAKDLKKQYQLIHSDFLRLKSNVERGYSMARSILDKKRSFWEFLKNP